MTREEITALCQRQLDAWNAHDPGAIGAFFASDATVHDAGGETAAGRDAIEARAKAYMDAFPDLRLDIESIEVDGNKYAYQWKAWGTNTGSLAGMPPTNKHAQFRAVIVLRFWLDMSEAETARALNCSLYSR